MNSLSLVLLLDIDEIREEMTDGLGFGLKVGQSQEDAV